jgi:hypothetical protein
MRVSQWAGLHNRQAELDFVDIDTDADTRLFVDPFAIDIRADAWSALCSRHLRSFFTSLITALRVGDDARAAHLASHLHEANETFLGLSKGRPKGRGIGREQAQDIIAALRRSRAVQTGLLSELGEAELFIEGIGSDKISDLTTNIIRGPLLEYTKEQAELWNMPLSDGLVVGAVWDPNQEEWIQEHRSAILVDGHPVILVPKFSVRRKLGLNTQEFYNHYMLSFLQQEYLHAGQALVTVLKSGERKVYKSSIKPHHPKSKSGLAEFAFQHPEVLAQYKRIAGSNGALEPEEMEQTFDERLYAAQLSNVLDQIPAGSPDAGNYHSYCIGALTFLLYPNLISPVKEREVDQGRKRIDIAYKNAARDGFFSAALQSNQMRSLEIPIECKNYSQDIANPELDQLTGRFSHARGFLGFLCCRSFDHKDRFVQRCRDAVLNRSHYVIVLDDIDLKEMLRNVANGHRIGNDAFLRRRLAEITA